jgi:hypothetical protein
VIRRIVLTAAGLAILTACATGGEVSERAARDLRDRVGALRTAVETGNRPAARAELRDLEDAVGQWRDRDLLSEERADLIISAASDVAGRLSLLPAPVRVDEPSATASPSPSPPPEEGEEEEDEEADHSSGSEEGGHFSGSEEGSNGEHGNKGEGKAKGHED